MLNCSEQSRKAVFPILCYIVITCYWTMLAFIVGHMCLLNKLCLAQTGKYVVRAKIFRPQADCHARNVQSSAQNLKNILEK